MISDFVFGIQDLKVKEESSITAYASGSQPVGHNPLWVEHLFRRGHLQPLENTDSHIMIHNSRNLQS